MIYCVEWKNDTGHLTGLYIGTDGSTIGTGETWESALKFYDRKSAERFRTWFAGKYRGIDLKNLEVTEHEEVDNG